MTNFAETCESAFALSTALAFQIATPLLLYLPPYLLSPNPSQFFFLSFCNHADVRKKKKRRKKKKKRRRKKDRKKNGSP